MSNESFKQCPGCGRWLSLEDLSNHPDIHPIGLVADPRDSNHCYLYFHDQRGGCGGSFVIHTHELRDEAAKTVASNLEFGYEECGGVCTYMHELTHCAKPCRLRLYRELMVRFAGVRLLNKLDLVNQSGT